MVAFGLVAQKKGSMQPSNLDNFIDQITPVVRSQHLRKSEIRKLNKRWYPCESETMEYFKFQTLWSCYDELSAYGAKVPIRLHDGGLVVKFYVPHLSAIQVYTATPTPCHCYRVEVDQGDAEIRSSCSDERRRVRSSSEEGRRIRQLNGTLGYLYCQHFEKALPFFRIPLSEKINELSKQYCALKSLRSVDVSPASWMAVAWYPIYHIPTATNAKDLSTCFLTYHSLSSSSLEMDPEGDQEWMSFCERKKNGEGFPLLTFALATHKMEGDMWTSGRGGADRKRLDDYRSSAKCWLRQLRVDHHDFNYFTAIHSG